MTTVVRKVAEPGVENGIRYEKYNKMNCQPEKQSGGHDACGQELISV